MKRAAKKIGMDIAVFFAVFLFLFTLSACAFGQNVTIALSRTQLTLAVGESCDLVADVSDGSSMTWVSGNADIATVTDGGTVTGVSEGQTVITAACSTALASCTVTVTSAGADTEVSSDGASASSGEAGDISSGAEGSDTADGTGEDELTLVWSDEFEGDALDTEKWGYQTGTYDIYHGVTAGPSAWGNNELQYYTEDSVSVADGIMTITAQRRDYEGMEYTSGRILTRDLASFTYGYFEARMSTPEAQGMWPAFWMLPQPSSYSSTDNAYGGWAANGEIDIMEAKGRLQNVVDTTLHFGSYWPENAYLSSSYEMDSGTSEWHVYALDWQETSIVWYIDGTEVFAVESSEWWTSASDEDGAPFDQPFYLLFDLAVGGDYDGGRAPADDFASDCMCVDYVRVYAYS